MAAGRVSQEAYDSRVERTNIARGLMAQIDEILLIKDKEERDRRLWDIKEEGERMMASTVCNKKDLDWDAGSIWSNAPRVATGLLKSYLPFNIGKRRIVQ